MTNLKSCDLLLTGSCMLKCKICQIWKRKKDAGELNAEEWKDVINSLAQLNLPDPLRIHFGGGEPFFNQDILEFVRFAEASGFKTMTTSNGFVIDQRMAEKIFAAKLSHISFSLDSLDSNIHDYLRGARGSQKKVIKAIDYLSNPKGKPTLGINCIICATNLDSIIPMADWVIQNKNISGVIFQAVVQPHDTPQDDAWYTKTEFSELWPKDLPKLDRVLDQLIQLKEDGNGKISNSIAQLEAFKLYFRNPLEFIEKVNCPMDGSSLLVNWLGQVYLCGLLECIGNARCTSIKEILDSEVAKERYLQLKTCRRNCNNKVNCFFEEQAVKHGN